MVGFATLSVTVWWIRKLGAATAVGIIATVVNFIFNPYGFHFLGFTVASIVFDAATKLMGYEWCFKNPLRITISMLPVSVLSASVAGLIIGTFFMPPTTLVTTNSILTWAGLHAFGGVIGGVIGMVMVASLTTRGIHKIDVKQ
jgi:hypothetical protein